MSCYIVTFETNTTQSLDKVSGVLKAFEAYCPIHKYCWAVVTEEKAAAIRDKVKDVLNPGERVFVIRSGTESAWLNAYGQKNTEWLKRNL